ncbi:DUF655 domain-containing protein [Haloferacaceae archaeon DSL9]
MPTSENGDADRPSAKSDAVVLDYLPHGRPDDTRPQYQKSPLAYALGTESFGLYELTLAEDADIGFGDRVPLDTDDPTVERIRTVEYDDLSRAATSEIEYAVEAILDADETRFVDFYNDAQPITLRLHQLNLLPGIGKKLRNKILDERKRGPFEDFEELSERVSGLHRPKEVLIERILEELRDDDLKYKAFVRRDQQQSNR